MFSQRMQLVLDISQIPDPDRFVCGTGCENSLRTRVEGDGIDCVRVLVCVGSCGAGCVGFAGVDDLERQVV